MLDLQPATQTLSELVQGVRDDQLTAQTPCTGTSLATMLDHVDGLALAFTAAATKTAPPAAADLRRLTRLGSPPTGAPGSRPGSSTSLRRGATTRRGRE
jgi:hypothetical protein